MLLSEPFDPQAVDWEELRRRLQRLLRSAYPSLSPELAEDVVQDALVRVLRALDRVEGPGLLSSSYLKKVVVSALIDEIRRRRRRSEESLDAEADPAADFAEPRFLPEQATADRELREALGECLSGLIPPRRRAMVLYLLGYGVPEVAERTGWDAKRAENLVYRGREDLRGCLTKKGVLP